VICAAFLSLQFGLVIFGQKNIDIKAACKMLMKFTKGQRPHNFFICIGKNPNIDGMDQVNFLTIY